MKNTSARNFAFIFALVFAGEMIFSVPFHVTRYFRPTFLEVFSFSNTQLGDAFAYYGITAMASYYFGWPLADRYSARGLMTCALVTTAIAGFYMATIPNYTAMAWTYAALGVTTIFLFWAAMIKATREWGGETSQGKAFGFLDGGRGLVAAVMAAIAVYILGQILPSDLDLTTAKQRQQAISAVFTFYASGTLLAALLVWLFIPTSNETNITAVKQTLTAMIGVIKRAVTWSHASVIVCAYCAYKGLDNYSLYAVQVLNMNEVEAAKLSTYGAYLRPIGAIAAGYAADRYSAGKITLGSFIVLVALFGWLSSADISTGGSTLIIANLAVSYLAVFAFRGLYYALLSETDVPKHLTGTTVGLIAFVGYTPDVFFGAISGRILDASPGVTGHQNFFLFLSVIMIIGSLATGFLHYAKRKNTQSQAS